MTRGGLGLAILLLGAIPAAVIVPGVACAQAREGRTLGPQDVRDLRAQLGGAVAQRDAARRQVAVSRADLRRVADIFGLPAGASPGTISDQLARWADQDAKNRDDLARLTEIVTRLEAGEIRSAAEQHLQEAEAAFEDGRLEDADQALSRLESLRRSGQAEARQAWVDAVVARSSLADQRLDGDTARRLVREARLEERALSNHTQWRYAMREADSYVIEDRRRRDNIAIEEAIAVLRDEALPLVDRARDAEDWALTQNTLGLELLTLGAREPGTERLLESLAAFQAALEVRTRERFPVDWAKSQSNMGGALLELAEREAGTERLDQAVAASRAALEVRTREAMPLEWAATQSQLGTALLQLGSRDGGSERLNQAAAAFRAALEAQPRAEVPQEWAATQLSLGNVYLTLARRGADAQTVRLGIVAYRAALEEINRERSPLSWASVQSNLGGALLTLGERENSIPVLEEAIAALRAALEERPRDRVPLDWASTQINLGVALSSLGERETGTEHLDQSVEAYRAALLELTRERAPLRWAAIQNNLGNVLGTLGERETGTERLEEAVTAYQAALQERTRERVPRDWAFSQFQMSAALQTIGQRTGDLTRFKAQREPMLLAAETFEGIGAATNAAAVRELVAAMDEAVGP